MFDLPRPCQNCPFLRDGGIRLTRLRAREIAENQIDPDGQGFPCHKTVSSETHDAMAENGEFAWVKGMQYCAGAIVFALNNESFNSSLQIAMRTCEFRPELRTPDVRASVFDSVYEMECAQLPGREIPQGRSPHVGKRIKKTRGRHP